MDKEQIKETVGKEVDQAKKQLGDAAKDAVPFFQKHKKAVIIAGVVLVVAVVLLVLIF